MAECSRYGVKLSPINRSINQALGHGSVVTLKPDVLYAIIWKRQCWITLYEKYLKPFDDAWWRLYAYIHKEYSRNAKKLGMSNYQDSPQSCALWAFGYFLSLHFFCKFASISKQISDMIIYFLHVIHLNLERNYKVYVKV